VPRPAPDLAHDHLTRMDAQTHGQVHPPRLPQAGIEWPQGFDHPEPSPHRPRRVITLGEDVRLLQATGQRLRLPQGEMTERLEVYPFRCRALLHCLREHR
jgi:hypothetical protein